MCRRCTGVSIEASCLGLDLAVERAGRFHLVGTGSSVSELPLCGVHVASPQGQSVRYNSGLTRENHTRHPWRRTGSRRVPGWWAGNTAGARRVDSRDELSERCRERPSAVLERPRMPRDLSGRGRSPQSGEWCPSMRPRGRLPGHCLTDGFHGSVWSGAPPGPDFPNGGGISTSIPPDARTARPRAKRLMRTGSLTSSGTL